MFGRGRGEVITFEPDLKRDVIEGVNVYSFDLPVDERPILIGRPTTKADLKENGVQNVRFVPILNKEIFEGSEEYLSRQAVQLELGKRERRVVRREKGTNQVLVFNAGENSVRPLTRGDSRRLSQPIEGNDVIIFDNGLRQPLAVLTFVRSGDQKTEMALIPLVNQDPGTLANFHGVASDAVHFALGLKDALANITEWKTWRTRSGSTVLERDLFLQALAKIDSIKDAAERTQKRQLLFHAYKEGNLRDRKNILMAILNKR